MPYEGRVIRRRWQKGILELDGGLYAPRIPAPRPLRVLRSGRSCMEVRTLVQVEEETQREEKERVSGSIQELNSVLYRTLNTAVSSPPAPLGSARPTHPSPA